MADGADPQPPLRPPPWSSASSSSAAARFAASARLPALSQPNASSVSLVSSTARGQPIPLSDTTAADRTTALRELSRSQPTARPRHPKAPGPPPSAAGASAGTTGTTTGTYSQPVLVRTYSGPIASSTRARSASRRDAISAVRGRSSAPSSGSNSSSSRRRRPGFAVALIRPLVGGKPSPGDDVKLPPLEAFSFKSIMVELEQGIGADLDRIADICARSRYSLSNQYEIHVAPHGSGAAFGQGVSASALTNTPSHHSPGPTLQAIPLDDEHANGSTSHGSGGLVRRKSAAYGTLETIISSSLSSDEDRSKRKSASEIAAQVRGRFQHSSPERSGNEHATVALASGGPPCERTKRPSRARPTLAAAILDRSRAQIHCHPDPPPPRTSGTDLVSKPAIPETSRSHLVGATTREGLLREDGSIGTSAKEQTSVPTSNSMAPAVIAASEERRVQPGLLGGFRFGIPWIGTSTTALSSAGQTSDGTRSYAEGTLRQLLGITDSSGNRRGKSAGVEEAIGE